MNEQGAQLFLVLGMIIPLALAVTGWVLTQRDKKVLSRVSSDLSNSTQKHDAVKVKAHGADVSFTERIIIPMAIRLSEIVQRWLPMGPNSWIRQTLIHAGLNKESHFKIFLGSQVLCVLAPVGFILFIALVGQKLPINQVLLWSIIFGGAGFGFPMLWLIDKAQKREKAIQKAIPDFLDLLVISVEAGLGLDMAIKKIASIESMESSKDLRKELLKYTADINLGQSRRQALQNMSERSGVEDLNTISGALIQAFEMGTGIAQTLRIQAEDLRNKRLMRAETQANKISTKMVLPTYLFFFPGIFIIALGPMVFDAMGKLAMMKG